MQKGTATASEPQNESGNSMIKVNVKYRKQSIRVKMFSDSTVKGLKSILKFSTGVLPREQKLIYKGRLLVDGMTLRSSEITNGSKIMLIESEGLHQGDGPQMMEGEKEKVDVESHLERWIFTGIIGFFDCNLKAVPEEVWTVGSFIRILDLRHNLLQECPARICHLTSIKKLLLDGNDISDESVHWEGLSSLKSLTVLSLNQNNLQIVPSALGALTCLKNVEIGNNQLICLPTEIGLLTKLEVLKANNNRLNIVPESIGGCISLVEVDLSSNFLVELPETFGKLKDLQALNLSNNGLRSLPSSLFKMCVQLSILGLHGTEITMDILRQVEGWEDFDTRRRLKHQKRLDFGVISSDEFDEGADKS